MKHCPKCGSSRWKEGKDISHCPKCGFINDRTYLEKKKNELTAI